VSARPRANSTRRADQAAAAASVHARTRHEIHASVSERLGGDGIRYTRSRRALVNVLAETCRPLTVDEIRSEMAGPQSTVYRTLDILEETGLVHRVTNNTSDFARFELAEDLLGHHHHFACALCGTMIDVTLADKLEADLLRALVRLATRQHFVIDTYQLDIVGACSTCSATDRPLRGKRQRTAAVTPATNSSRNGSGSHV